jgi:hypothetical protein
MAGGTARTRNKGKEPARQLPTGQSTTSRSETLGRDNSGDVIPSTQTQRFEELDEESDEDPPLDEDDEDELASNLPGHQLDPVNSQPPDAEPTGNNDLNRPEEGSPSHRPGVVTPTGTRLAPSGRGGTRREGGVTPGLQDEDHHARRAPPPATGSNRHPIGVQAPIHPVPVTIPVVSRSSQDFIQRKMEEIWQAEDDGVAPERIAQLRARLAEAKEHMQDVSGNPSQSRRPAHDDAGKLMGTLNKVQPKPKLGSDLRGPSPQAVAQWILDVETAFASVQALEDSTTRTYWVLSTIQFNVHRELLQQQINLGQITTWSQLKAEQLLLVQDPVLTKYQNYSRLFNFEWRTSDNVNSFLLQLSKKEALTSNNFFDRFPDDELKIAYVWSKLPDTYTREMQRSGVLENIRTWPEFERALRNAETAVTSAAPKAPRQGPEDAGAGRQKSKRHASSQVTNSYGKKKRDYKPAAQSHQRSRDTSPAGDRRNNVDDDKKNENRPNNSNGNQRSHWKNRNRDQKWEDRDDKRRDDDAGKGKP